MANSLPFFEWQYLNTGERGITAFRAKVPGGWLVGHNWSEAGGLTFYPDPEHLWDGGTLPLTVRTSEPQPS